MKTASRASATLAALLVGAACWMTMAARAPQIETAATPSENGSFPTPTNLKVLPKNLTGQQVHDLMEQWEAGLGMSCSACHAEDKEKVDQDGKPLLNFASDSKAEKAAARLMYTMTAEINEKYIAKIDASGMPVTCGTCHRGRLGPEPFAGASNPGPSAPMAPAPSGAEQPNR